MSSLASARRALADERIDDLKLAVSEACTNAIEAHGAADADEHVRIRVLGGRGAPRGVGRGPRPGLRPRDPAAPTPRSPIPSGSTSSGASGIPLIRTLVDDVEFRTSAGGTSVRMTLFGGPAELEPPRDLGRRPPS